MMPILVSSGEPCGIGIDLCLDLVSSIYPVVVLADPKVLQERAQLLKRKLDIVEYHPGAEIVPDKLNVLPLYCDAAVVPGKLNAANAGYVINMLTYAAELCQRGDFSALVTGPVQKSLLNIAGIAFTGHTEFLAQFYQVPRVVMMLASPKMRVALATTHLALKDVATQIDTSLIQEIILILHNSLRQDFGIIKPKILLAGLNPHAGEGGFLGDEEIRILKPSLEYLRNMHNIDVSGPVAADTWFYQNICDVFLAMYHDQGLPLIKYADFESAVNITLGLPIIRTSVDHGTALDLVGLGRANAKSLLQAVRVAFFMAICRKAGL
jgi:4-hydroxythreonine-4-phosphate dehydrogenase